jgi:hypothetical protein
MTQRTTRNDGAADPIAAEGADADYGDGGDADNVDSDDAREPDYRPHGNRRCRYDWEVTWYPLVRQGIELAFWLKNAIRLDVKRIDLLDGGLISIDLKSSRNEYKDTPDCYIEEYELSLNGYRPNKRTVPLKVVQCRFCDDQMPPLSLDGHCFVSHPDVNTVAALRASCPDLPPLDGYIPRHFINTLDSAIVVRLAGGRP